jgi:uncharacterized protein YukE
VTDEVKFTDAQWDALAQAAEAFADTLEDERGRIRDTLAKNWAGDCVEGLAVFENLRQLLHGDANSFTQAANAESNYLRNLAAQCRNSKETLGAVDQYQSDQFGVP